MNNRAAVSGPRQFEHIQVMTTQTLPSQKKVEPSTRLLRNHAITPSTLVQKQPLLLLSCDELFCQDLLGAATETGRRVVRIEPTSDGLLNLQILKPAAVLLDLDSPSKSNWDIADLLLQDKHCP